MLQAAINCGSVRAEWPRGYPGGVVVLAPARGVERASLDAWLATLSTVPESMNVAPTPKRKVGAPGKADWPALEERFRQEVEKRGKPDPLNEKGWQRQADVARWLVELATKEGDEVGFEAAKKQAQKFMKRLE